MRKLADPPNRSFYEREWESLFDLAYNGQRTYYTNPTIETDPRLDRPVANLFTIRQTIQEEQIDSLMNIEFGPYKNRKKYSKNYVENDLYLNRLCDEIKERTWTHAKMPISGRITFEWPSCEFDRWLEETHEYHWMTATWQRFGDKWFSGDFEVLTTVWAPVLMDLDEYDSQWGQAIVMTKMTM